MPHRENKIGQYHNSSAKVETIMVTSSSLLGLNVSFKSRRARENGGKTTVKNQSDDLKNTDWDTA
ncbi:hypothetical protein ACUIJQ_06195 [Levilactobacillus hammesii]|uniref:hypothetical protein n=1 Tax=Levilactobacillus hammesii TaxID=267633 RepID=UPI0012ED24C2|nr:hypothetical protein [Levilactobacillus hammesii]